MSEKCFTIKELAKHWADAPTLYEFTNELAQKIGADDEIMKEHRSKDPDLLFWNSVGVKVVRRSDEKFALAKARRKVGDDLIAGRVVGIGRRSESVDFEVFPPLLWVGAKFDWRRNSAIRGEEKVVDLRVIANSNVTPDSVVYKTPGPKSVEAIILEALAEYEKENSGFPSTLQSMFESLKAAIFGKYPECRGKRGFSDANIYKYLKKYRDAPDSLLSKFNSINSRATGD